MFVSYLRNMEFEAILKKITSLAIEQFNEKKQEITRDSTASDIGGWNSLSHVMLIASIEKEFGIKFDLLQMIDMKSIGDIATATHKMVT